MLFVCEITTYLYPSFVVFFPTRKLANSPERHAEHTISLRLRQHHPERRQEVRLRAASGKLQKFNYVIRRVKPCRAQLKKNKPSSDTPSPSLSALPPRRLALLWTGDLARSQPARLRVAPSAPIRVGAEESGRGRRGSD